MRREMQRLGALFVAGIQENGLHGNAQFRIRKNGVGQRDFGFAEGIQFLFVPPKCVWHNHLPVRKIKDMVRQHRQPDAGIQHVQVVFIRSFGV